MRNREPRGRAALAELMAQTHADPQLGRARVALECSSGSRRSGGSAAAPLVRMMAAFWAIRRSVMTAVTVAMKDIRIVREHCGFEARRSLGKSSS
jgi:hypothetical protein